MTVILGAGMAGLSAAYYALQNPKLASIVVLEASNRVGGWVCSKEQPDGTIFEQGPRTIRPLGPSGINTLELVEQLGLSDKVISINHSHPAARNRLIYADGQLHLLPNGFMGFIKKSKLLNDSLLFSVLRQELKAPKVSKDDESIYSFAERRFGKNIAEKIIAPMICGIYAGDAHEISIKYLMNNLFEAEQKHGSLIKGIIFGGISQLKRYRAELKKKKSITNANTANTPPSLVETSQKEFWTFWSIKGGLEQLPAALANNITKRGVKIKMGCKCEQLKFHKDHAELIVKGESQKYSSVISSLPAKSLADLVQEQHPELSKELRDIPTVTVGVVNLQFHDIKLPVLAFGLLVPPTEELPILGVIFDSCVFSPHSKTTVLTVMMGGAWFEKYFGKCSSREHLLSVAIHHVKKILRIQKDPDAFQVSILKDCIPQYVVGHAQRLDRINNYISTHKIPLGLCGSSYRGVGINDVILSAKQAVSDTNWITQ